MPLQLEKLKENISDEKISWPQIQELRNSFNPKLFDSVKVISKQQALGRMRQVVYNTLDSVEKGTGLTYVNVCPGHAAGHIARDYVNSLTLFSKLDIDPKHLFIGAAGGILHDLGCTVIDRYAESTRAVRHAEAGALLLREIFSENSSIGLNDAEKTLIQYAVAAHTHYRSDEEVKCSDGETRIVKPYQELDEKENPIFGIWFARWVDRLDCNGPTFPARHYLTLGEEHKDYDGETHFDVKFEQHMRPLLRPFKEQVDEEGNRNQTMSEQMKMFADSQNNDSPYGKHDFGTMVEFRDSAKEMLYKIIQATQEQTEMDPDKEKKVMDTWNDYLALNIEPTMLGRKTSNKLTPMFKALSQEIRYAWLNGFQTAMQEYKIWADNKLTQLEDLAEQSLGEEIFRLPMVTEDVGGFIKPNF